MKAILVTDVGILGLVIGSFLSVVVHRVPKHESIVGGRSYCPNCGVQIRAVDNVPVLAYLVRRGRCRACGIAISPRYLILELTTGALFAAVAYRSASWWDVAPFCVLAASLIAVSAIDIELFRVPTKILYACVALGAPLLVLASAETHDWGALVRALVGGALSLIVLLILHLAVPRGMGLGDVRLAGVCGGFLGWLGYRLDFTGIWLSFIIGGVFGVALLLTGRARRGSHIPFAPFLAAGTMLAVLFGAEVARLRLP
jgi:leader peptidase (prepilin peptidase)/N-methyltransferase